MGTRQPPAGLTLIELLVAFLIFLALMLSLVSFSTILLDSWTRGEIRKDSYDAAEAAMAGMEDDLGNLFIERQLLYLGRQDKRRYLQGAHLICHPDELGRPVLRFVRSSDVERTRKAPRSPGNRIHPADLYADLYEVVYRFGDDPKDTTLYRAIRHFDRIESESLLGGRHTFASAKDQYRPVDDGILHLEIRFWDSSTQAWEATGRAPGSRSRSSGGVASPWWDSSRGQLWDRFCPRSRWKPPFYLKPKQRDLRDPDLIYPEMVRVRMTIRSKVFRERRVVLSRSLSRTEKIIHVNSTKDLPDPPGFVRIGAEWIGYSGKTFSTITVRERGARGTAEAVHPAGSEVLFGPVFTRVFHLAVRQEPVRR